MRLRCPAMLRIHRRDRLDRILPMGCREESALRGLSPLSGLDLALVWAGLRPEVRISPKNFDTVCRDYVD